MLLTKVKRVAVIFNSTAASRSFVLGIVRELSSEFQTELFETRSPDDAVALASCAVERKFDAVIAAGGDGTLHQVVNGILQGREQQERLPCIGLIPVGSGNDFARTVQIGKNSDDLITLIRNSSMQLVDVGKIDFRAGAKPRYFINEVSIGLGPEVLQKLRGRSKFLPGLSYYLATLSAFFSYKPYSIRAITSVWEWCSAVKVFSVANGKYFGHGLCIAPEGRPDDGIFSVFACGGVSVLDFIRFTGALKRGKYIDHPGISYRSASSVEILSENKGTVEADGEIVGTLPVTISIITKRLWFLKQNAPV